MIDGIRCVVLNSTYEFLDIVPAKRALTLYFENKAIISKAHPVIKIKSAKAEWDVPIQIVLKQYVKGRNAHKAKAKLTQRNLFVRDDYTCQYCGRHSSQLESHEILNRDHVHPQDKGGKDTWLNLVTSCSTCNNKKANMLLDDFHMQLINYPHEPTAYEIRSKIMHKYMHSHDLTL